MAMTRAQVAYWVGRLRKRLHAHQDKAALELMDRIGQEDYQDIIDALEVQDREAWTQYMNALPE